MCRSLPTEAESERRKSSVKARAHPNKERRVPEKMTPHFFGAGTMVSFPRRVEWKYCASPRYSARRDAEDPRLIKLEDNSKQ